MSARRALRRNESMNSRADEDKELAMWLRCGERACRSIETVMMCALFWWTSGSWRMENERAIVPLRGNRKDCSEEVVCGVCFSDSEVVVTVYVQNL